MARRATYMFTVLLLCAAMTAPAAAQGSPAQWLARIFDPASLGIKQFPGAKLNRKLSMDAIILERGGSKRIAAFIIPLDALKPAADHFAKQFGVPAHVTGEGSRFVTYTFDFRAAGTGPPRLTGLRVIVSRSQFVDNKGQITMEYVEYVPPKPK